MNQYRPSSGDAERAGVLVLGVDGGGSKTVARLMSVGGAGGLCVLGEGTASGSNPLSVGSDAAREAIRAAVQAACRGVGASKAVDSAVLAIAGCSAPDLAVGIQRWGRETELARDVLVVDDTRPLLASVGTDEAAIGLIAGTGSSAIAKSAGAEPEVVGGWGYLVDDAGSGFDLGQRGLRHAVRRLDASGGQGDPLTKAALAYTESTDAVEFKRAVYAGDDARRFIAGFAAQVVRLAIEGDAAAEAIVDVGAAALTDLASNAWRRIGEPTEPRPAILMSGGLLQRSGFYQRRVVDRLLDRGWPRNAVRLAPDAATGCGILAARRLHVGR